MKKIISLLLIVFILQTVANSQESSFRDSIDVLHYSINLSILNLKKKEISGNTELTVLPTFNNSRNFKLELSALNVDSIFINKTKNTNWTHKNGIISINTQEEININDTLIINIFYQGRPIKDAKWGGFYFSDTDAFNMGVGMASYPHGYGRVWYPCIDNFTDKATYDYYIMVASEHTAVCSGILVSEKKNDDNTKTYHWQLTDEISTYISSVAVAEYELMESTYKGIERDIPVQIYVSPTKVTKAKGIFSNVHKALEIYENLFGAYQWQRVGYVEVSFNAGAMEHATNIAYPSYAISSWGKRETLMTHELSHAWFGNCVTCKTSGDMWLNEGWASYCEALFIEFAYSKEQAKDYVRANLFNVLTNTHISDKGYLPVSGVSKENTYGSTVYDKGSCIVHTLRGYLGDSLFFGGTKAYLKEYKFKTASSNDLCEFMSKYSGIDLHNFFDFWVYSPGFNFFEITDYSEKKVDTEKYKVYVDVAQHLKKAEKYANRNKIEITFVGKNFETQTDLYEFSGEKGQKNFIIPFEPEAIMLDINEKICDATTDNYKIIKKTSLYKFPHTFVELKVHEITDSVFVRVQANWYDLNNEKNDKYEFSPIQYWTIQGVFNKNFKASILFYIKTDNFNNSFVTKNKSNILLLHRSSPQEDWKPTKYTEKNNYFEVSEFKKGDYVFAKKK